MMHATRTARVRFSSFSSQRGNKEHDTKQPQNRPQAGPKQPQTATNSPEYGHLKVRHLTLHHRVPPRQSPPLSYRFGSLMRVEKLFGSRHRPLLRALRRQEHPINDLLKLDSLIGLLEWG